MKDAALEAVILSKDRSPAEARAMAALHRALATTAETYSRVTYETGPPKFSSALFVQETSELSPLLDELAAVVQSQVFRGLEARERLSTHSLLTVLELKASRGEDSDEEARLNEGSAVQKTAPELLALALHSEDIQSAFSGEDANEWNRLKGKLRSTRLERGLTAKD